MAVETPTTITRPAARRPPARFWVAGLLALGLMAAAAVQGSRLRFDRTLVCDFADGPQALLGDPRRFTFDGFEWTGQAGGALSLAPGGLGNMTAFVTFSPGERVTARLVAANGGPVRTVLVLQPPSGGSGEPRQLFLPLPELDPGGGLAAAAVDLTPNLSPADHYFYLSVTSRNDAPPGSPANPALARFELEFQAPPPPPADWRAAIFFLATGWIGWWAILGFLLPRAERFVRRALRVRPERRWRAPAAGLLLIAAAGVASHHVWREPKQYDDLWAMGNARLLPMRSYQTGGVFFRSRIRPAYPPLAMPLATLLPHKLLLVTFTPADGHERLFYVFDREGWSWAQAILPEASLWGLAMALTGALLIGACWLARDRLPGRRLRALLAVAMAAWFLHRTLGGPLLSPVTESVTWAFQIAAMLAYLEFERRPNRWTLPPAAAMTALALLLKESALALAVPLALLQLDTLWRRRREAGAARRWVASVAVFWLPAALPALIYFGAIIDGGFGEISHNMALHLQGRHGGLENFETRTPAGAARALWAVFGWGLIPAAIGLWAVAQVPQRRNPAVRLAAVWLLGGCAPFLLPYFYPRFFIYMIPAVAWLAAAGLVAVGGGLRGREAVAGAGGSPPGGEESQ
jgi:hypothetical protein